VKHRGRAVLAMDCVLAGVETHRGRPLNSIVSFHARSGDERSGTSGTYCGLPHLWTRTLEHSICVLSKAP
jgi:hypothetical protein